MKHYAAYWNNTVFEITAQTPDYVHHYECDVNEFKMHNRILASAAISSSMNVTVDAIASYIEKWLRLYPRYDLLRGNCQLFVQDISRDIFDVNVTTQTDEAIKYGKQIVSNGLEYGTKMIKFGSFMGIMVMIVGVLVGLLLIAIGYGVILYHSTIPLRRPLHGN